MTTYDPRNMSWDLYCSLMAELFSANQIGTVQEDDWRVWVDGIAGIGYFLSSGVPDSRNFDMWQDWAEQLVGIMALEQ